MKNDAEIIQSLVIGGVVGGALGRLVLGRDSVMLSTVAGAAIVASYLASQNAKKTNVPIVVEENGALYEISMNGTKKWLKDLPQPQKKISKRFILK